MLKDGNIPAESAWNTWSHRPADLVYLPDGVSITPVLYSSRLRKAIAPTAREMRFDLHESDGRAVAFQIEHGGTRLSFRYGRSDPYAVAGAWEAGKKAEWGLRYWVTLCLSAAGGEEVRYDPATGTASVTVGRRVTTLLTGAPPVQVTGHDSVEAVIADFDEHGYFYTGSRAVQGKVLALRFNLEMMPKMAFAAAVADSAELSMATARQRLEADVPTASGALQTGRSAGALDAIRDVIGWNTLYDTVNRRRYTAISRIWNLGDFAVWYNDQTFAALMAGLFDGELARENFRVALASATPQGNFACLLTSRDAWVDRTQAPHGAFMLWLMYLRSRDVALLRMAYPALARNHRWWRANRDPDGIGLVSCGTSDVGEALYKGTAFGARNETGMDNSATHDEAVYDPVTRTLSTIDLGLNCALALDAEMLALIAAELGEAGEAAEFACLAEDTRGKIRAELWDEARGIFANRQRRGGFVKSLGPTSFYPLLCGAASEDQARRLLDHLADPDLFGGPYMIPNATRDDPAYAENVYWRGRIWGNVNYFVWHGLRRYGFAEAAEDLAAKSFAMFDRNWRDSRVCGENYNAGTGEVTDQVDADPFYTWGAMLPLLAVNEVMDVSPWHGWTITNSGAELALGPVLGPAGEVVVTIAKGLLTLARGVERLWSSDFRGPLRNIVMDAGLCSFELGEDATGKPTFRLGASASAGFVEARIDGKVVKHTVEDEQAVVPLAGLRAGARIDIHLVPRA